MPEKSITDLPPELLDHITTYLSSADALAHLGQTNKSLHTYVEKDAWQTFAKGRFPSLSPPTSDSYKHVTRTLTTLSRAWDRRAFVARYTEPRGNITTHPGAAKTDRWKRPKGQTIGFTPHLDVYEEDAGRGRRREVLAYSAGAEVCLRTRDLGQSKPTARNDNVRWSTYRPLTAYEGRDDVTSLHLLPPTQGGHHAGQRFITGTANGDLQLISLPEKYLPEKNDGGLDKIYFTTQGQGVRSSSLLQRDNEPSLLAAAIGDTKICLYPLSEDQPKIVPSSEVDIKPGKHDNNTSFNKAYRAWSTELLSSRHLAVGLGPSEDPLHVYSITPSGISADHVRKFSLQVDSRLEDRLDETAPGGVARKPMSSVYPIVSLPRSSVAASNLESEVFLSGAYDGIIRLHDLRSDNDVVGMYSDPTDDSAIYSLLPRGRESLLAGTSRHNLLKFFDLRMGAKCYSYLDAGEADLNDPSASSRDWSLFLKPHTDPSASRSSHPWGGGNGRRQIESSVYTLSSASATSPHIYAGISNNVIELAFTDVRDPRPDPLYFSSTKRKQESQAATNGNQHPQNRQHHPPRDWNGWNMSEVMNLACIEHSVDVNLLKQRPLAEALLNVNETIGRRDGSVSGLDWRWWDGKSESSS